MINHLVFSFFIINLFTSLFAADEVNTLILETSPSLESQNQPALPKLNISYDSTLAPEKNQTEYLQFLLNIEKDGSTYCPLTEILTRILNELRNLLPHGSDTVKDVLSKYYSILENALKHKNSIEPLNKFSSENRLNYIDSLAQQIITMDDKNAKIKISFEYKLPTMQNTICEKLCNDLINFANPENTPAINDLNYVNEGKIKNNVMTYLQNNRPENINSNSSYYKKLKKYFLVMKEPDTFNSLNADPSNPVFPNLPISNPLQSLSQPLSNNSGPAISDPLHNLAPVLKSQADTEPVSGQRNSSPPHSSSTGNENFISSQNFAAMFQKQIENLSPQFLEPKGVYNYPFQNTISMSQDNTGPLNSYPLQSLPQLIGISYNPLQTLAPHSQIPNGVPNSYSLTSLPPPVPNLKGNILFLQNAAHLPQNLIGPEDSYPIKNLPPHLKKLKEKAKGIDNFGKKNYADYHSNKNIQYHHENQKQIHYNNGNAVQHIIQNNPTIVTPQKSENSWSQANYASTNNAKLLQEKLSQSYNQNKSPVLNLIFESKKQDPKFFYRNINTNDLSNIKQHEKEKLKVDSSSAQASSLTGHYKQNLQSVQDLIYPLANPEAGYLLNQQIPYSSQNVIPFSNGKNNALFNLYVKNYNQLATQSITPNRLPFNPNLYYYYNPNLGITNSAQNTQETFSAQFQDLNRLLSVSNLDKLNFALSKNGMVELMYKFNNSKSTKEPFFYVKFKIPFDVFLNNLNNLLLEQPKMRNNLQLLYKDLLIGSNITSSSVLKNLDKEELLKLRVTNGTLVTAKVLDAKNTSASDQIKIVQKLNANMPLEDILKTDPNINKILNRTTNIPLLNILRNRLNYLDGLQSKIPLKKYVLNPYNILANQNYKFQYPNYLANRKPTPGYYYFQNKPNIPYPS